MPNPDERREAAIEAAARDAFAHDDDGPTDAAIWAELSEAERDRYRTEARAAYDAARSGEAEGEKLRSAANELLEAYDDWAVNSYPADNGSRNAAEAWHAESHRVNRAVEILRLALSEPR